MVEFAMEMPTFSGTTQTPKNANKALSHEELKKFLNFTGWTYQDFINHEKMYDPKIVADSSFLESTEKEDKNESDINCNKVEDFELNSLDANPSLINKITDKNKTCSKEKDIRTDVWTPQCTDKESCSSQNILPNSSRLSTDINELTKSYEVIEILSDDETDIGKEKSSSKSISLKNRSENVIENHLKSETNTNRQEKLSEILERYVQSQKKTTEIVTEKDIGNGNSSTAINNDDFKVDIMKMVEKLTEEKIHIKIRQPAPKVTLTKEYMTENGTNKCEKNENANRPLTNHETKIKSVEINGVDTDEVIEIDSDNETERRNKETVRKNIETTPATNDKWAVDIIKINSDDENVGKIEEDRNEKCFSDKESQNKKLVEKVDVANKNWSVDIINVDLDSEEINEERSKKCSNAVIELDSDHETDIQNKKTLNKIALKCSDDIIELDSDSEIETVKKKTKESNRGKFHSEDVTVSETIIANDASNKNNSENNTKLYSRIVENEQTAEKHTEKETCHENIARPQSRSFDLTAEGKVSNLKNAVHENNSENISVLHSVAETETRNGEATEKPAEVKNIDENNVANDNTAKDFSNDIGRDDKKAVEVTKNDIAAEIRIENVTLKEEISETCSKNTRSVESDNGDILERIAAMEIELGVGLENKTENNIKSEAEFESRSTNVKTNEMVAENGSIPKNMSMLCSANGTELEIKQNLHVAKLEIESKNETEMEIEQSLHIAKLGNGTEIEIEQSLHVGKLENGIEVEIEQSLHVAKSEVESEKGTEMEIEQSLHVAKSEIKSENVVEESTENISKFSFQTETVSDVEKTVEKLLQNVIANENTNGKTIESRKEIECKRKHEEEVPTNESSPHIITKPSQKEESENEIANENTDNDTELQLNSTIKIEHESVLEAFAENNTTSEEALEVKVENEVKVESTVGELAEIDTVSENLESKMNDSKIELKNLPYVTNGEQEKTVFRENSMDTCKEDVIPVAENETTHNTNSETKEITSNLPLNISTTDIQSVCSILDEYSDGFKDEFSISSASNNGDTNSDFLRKIDDFINAKTPEISENEDSNQRSEDVSGTDSPKRLDVCLPEAAGNESCSSVKSAVYMETLEERPENTKQRPLSFAPDLKSNSDDDIRNQLRLQLSLLRNKKKPVDLLKRSVPFEYHSSLIENTKKAFVATPKVVTLSVEETVTAKVESPFHILAVMGGVDLKDDEEPTVHTERIIKPSKTQDISKIKGWRTKKFADNFSSVISPVYVTVAERRLLRIEDVVYKYDLKHGEPAAATSKDDVSDSVSYNIEQGLVVEEPEIKQEMIEIDEETVFLPVRITEDTVAPKSPPELKLEEKENEKKSAFISDALDEFLSRNTKLNISYEVPKLVAEDNISKPSLDDNPFPKNPIRNVSMKKDNQQFPLASKAKPKTLAEKRRMMEQAKETNIKYIMENKNTELMQKLEAKNSKKRDFEFVKKMLINDNIPFTKECWDTATSKLDFKHYVTFNGVKLFVTASCTDEGQMCEIVEKNLRRNATKKNLQLSQAYRAGPLCKKPLLGYTTNEWTPIVKKMPTVQLEVYPEQGKPLPAKISNLLMVHIMDNVVDFARAQFAASAICIPKKNKRKTKDRTKLEDQEVLKKEKHVFEIPYANNQTKVLMRKATPKLNSSTSSLDSFSETPYAAASETSETPPPPQLKSTELYNDKTVCNIIEGMVNFVVNKEEFDNILIDYDISQENRSDQNSARPPSPLPSILSTIIKQPYSRKPISKTSAELRRLNVQFIEVDVMDDNDDKPDQHCIKSYCAMGCVCNSLQGPSNNLFTHCGRPECMFKCDCEFETKGKGHHKVTLPAGTNVLSAGTMVRLEDEAKRHLAKEEKKFTQTVIRANNQTIVVGSGLRDRSRRLGKVPAKYNDNACSDLDSTIFRMHEKTNVEASKPLNIKEFVKPKLWSQEEEEKEVRPKISKAKAKAMKKALATFKGVKTEPVVKLERFPLDKLIPFCLVHNFYRCKCGLKPPMKPQPDSTASLLKAAQKSAEAKEDNITLPQDDDPDSLLVPYKVIRVSETKRANYAERMGMASSDQHTCARTRGVPANHYRERNASELYRNRYKLLKEQQTRRQIQTYMNLKENMNKDPEKSPAKDNLDSEVSQPDVPQTKKPTRSDRSAPKRYSPELKPVNPRSTSSSPHPAKEDAMLSLPANLIDVNTSNSLLLKPTTALNQEFHTMLGLKSNSKIPFRLLGWKHLVEKYKQKSLHLWFTDRSKGNRIILTESNKKPQKNYKRVADYENIKDPKFIEQDVIRFLITDTLPNGASSADDIFVVLAFTQFNWEIKGIFERKPGNRKSFVEQAGELCAANEAMPEPTALQKESAKTPPKNLDPKKSSRGIQLCKNHWNVVELRSELEDSTSTLGEFSSSALNGVQLLNREIILARLPPIRYGKWWVLPLKDKFSLMSMYSSSITMKYNELLQLTRISNKSNMTIHVRAATKANRKPSYFGIYAVPETMERVFIGPYGPNQKTDCELWHTVDGNLVSSADHLGKTLGKWFFQMGQPAGKALVPKQFASEFQILDSSVVSNGEVSGASKQLDMDVEIISNDPVVIDLTELEEDDENEQEKKPSAQESGRRNKRKQDFPKIEYEPLLKVKKDGGVVSGKDTAAAAPLPTMPATSDITLIGFDNVETENMEVICKDWKSSRRVTKYFVTNVRGLGFIEAYYHVNLQFIDVIWPLTAEYWRFRKVEMAVKFIKELLKRRILFFPLDYVVDIKLVEKHPKTYHKLAPEILEGFHMVCGDELFDIRRTTFGNFIQLGLNREDYLRMVRKKCFALLNQEAKVLGQSFLSPEVLKSTPNSQIVDKACFEIKRLQDQEMHLKRQKTHLSKEKEDLIIKYGTIIDPLPQERKLVAQRMLLRILRNSQPSAASANSISDYVKQESPDELQITIKPNPPPQLQQKAAAAAKRLASPPHMLQQNVSAATKALAPPPKQQKRPTLPPLPQIVSVSSGVPDQDDEEEENDDDEDGAFVLNVPDAPIRKNAPFVQQVVAVGTQMTSQGVAIPTTTMSVAHFKEFRSDDSQNLMSILKNPNGNPPPPGFAKVSPSVAGNFLNKPAFIKLVPTSSGPRKMIAMKRCFGSPPESSSAPASKMRLVDPSCVFKLQQQPSATGNTVKLVQMPVTAASGLNFFQRMDQRQAGSKAVKMVTTTVTRSNEGQSNSTLNSCSPSKGRATKATAFQQMRKVLMHGLPPPNKPPPLPAQQTAAQKAVRVSADKLKLLKDGQNVRITPVPHLTPQNTASLLQINNPWRAEITDSESAVDLPPPPTLTPAPTIASVARSYSRAIGSSPPPPVLSPPPPFSAITGSPPKLFVQKR